MGEIPGVRLVDLTALGDGARLEPAVANLVADASLAVDAAARRFSDNLAAAKAGPVIAALRARMEETCRKELARRGGLAGSDALTEAAVHALVGQLMHRPTMLARAAAADGDERTLHLLCEAFGVTAVEAVACLPDASPVVPGDRVLGTPSAAR